MKIPRLFLSFAILFGCLLGNFPAFANPPEPGAKGRMMASGLATMMEQFKELIRPFVYDPGMHRDPMQSLVNGDGRVLQTSGFHQGLALQGIIWSGDFKRVLIDNEFYSEGDTVGPYRILEIKKEGFAAEFEGKKIFIPLYPEEAGAKKS